MSKIFKNINKKMLSIVLVFMALFYVCDDIALALTDEEWENSTFGIYPEGTHLQPSNSSASSTGNWQDSNYKVIDSNVGVRIFYVTSSGRQLAVQNGVGVYVADFIKNNYYENIEKYKFSSVKSSKATTGGKFASFTWENRKLDYSTKSLSSLTNVIGGISADNFSISGLQGMITTKIGALTNYEKRKFIANLLSLNSDKTVKTIHLKKYKDKDTGLYNIFMVYEPLMLVHMEGDGDIIATPTELLNYYYQPGDGTVGNSYDYSTSGCKDNWIMSNMGYKFCQIAQVVYQYGSCSSVLTEGLMQRLQNTNSLTFKNNFKTGYFSNSLKPYLSSPNDTASSMYQACVNGNSAKNFLEILGTLDNSSIKPGTGGIGIGIVWIDDSNSTTDNLTCSLVNDYFGITATPSCDDLSAINFGKFNLAYSGVFGTNIDANWYKSKKCCTSGTNRGFNCDTVKQFFGYSSSVTLTKSQAQSLNYSSFNSVYNSSIDFNWYADNCGVTTPYNCTPSYSIGTCTTNTPITYNDYNSNNGTESEFWQNCVFNDNGEYDINTHKWSNITNNPNLTYFESDLGDSEYCPVYCMEGTSAKLAENRISALAGQYIVLQGSVVTGSRTCKTKNIDYDKFTSNLSESQQKIIEEYVSYKAAESVINGGSWVQNGTCGGVKEMFGDYDTTDDPINLEKCSKDGFGFFTGSSCERRMDGHSCIEYNEGTSSGICKYNDSSASINWRWSNNGSNTGSFTYAGVTKTYTVNDVCQVDKPANPTVSTDEILKKINLQDTYINRMKNCYTWNDNNLYNLDVNAWIEWNLGIYSYNEQLDKTVSGNTSDSGSVCDDNNKETQYTFTNGTLNNSSASVSKCTSVSKTRISTLFLQLKSNLYNYIIKNNPNQNNFSVKSTTTLNGYTHDKFSTNYLNLGFGNLPVPFNLSTGVYNNAYTIKYVNLGHKKNDNSMVNAILSSSEVNTSGNYTNWSCDLNVTNDIFEKDSGPIPTPPGNINIIYREIDLTRPFPNIDNSNRDTGSNWCAANMNCSWDNGVVQRYILNNRNVTGSEIYNQTPMYTFIMKPDDILEIRKYNDSNSYENYTGTDATGNYDYKCNEGTGEACISGYLTHLLDILEGNNLPGTCKDARTRAYTDVTSFNNCRY